MWLMQFTHYLFGYVGTALCLVGLSLSLCSVYVFTRRQMRSAVATYLAALSTSDSCLLSLGLIIAINSSIPPHQQSELFYSSRLHKRLFPYVYPCIIWFQFTSVWITIGFAIDRWFAIKWPMLHYTYSSKRAFYIVVTIFVLGFIYSLPRFFEYKTEVQIEKLTISENLTEEFEHLVITNLVLDNRIYHYIVHLVLYSLFQSILPLLMLSYFNVELIRSIHASSDFLKHFTSLNRQNVRRGDAKSSSRYREGSVTRSVICLIGLFTLCQVPASILHYIYMFYRNHPVLYICYDISNFLILVNSAVNFFIFTYYNRKFRRELARICFHKKANQALALSTPSHASLRSNSHLRTLQQTPISMQQLHMTKTHSWDYQPRNGRPISQTDSRASQDHSGPIRDRSFDTSTQSQSLLHPFDHRSESLMNIPSVNLNQFQPSQINGRFSNYDLNQSKSANASAAAAHAPARKTPKKSLHFRRNSEQSLAKRRKSSLTNLPYPPTRPQGCQKSQFISNPCKTDQQKSNFNFSSMSQSPSKITDSNRTRSTVNTTASESSISTDLNRLFTSTEKSSRMSQQ